MIDSPVVAYMRKGESSRSPGYLAGKEGGAKCHIFILDCEDRKHPTGSVHAPCFPVNNISIPVVDIGSDVK